jgi:Tfp pilus assembly protein PilF
MGSEKEKALALVERAIQKQMGGEWDEAIRLYKKSIGICPTAEAHTYLGWTYSFQGRLEEATEECRTAIRIDPGFGNPYNDIGVYLMQQNKLDEAIPWLEKAKLAPRYEPRQFPYLNLGSIYAAKGMIRKALDEFRASLTFAPEDPQAIAAIQQLEESLN